MILDSLHIEPVAFERHTGWTLRPEGICRDDRCVPLPATTVTEGLLDVSVVAGRLGMPLVHDQAAGLWCLGPEAGGRALVTATAPDLTLPDWQGHEFHLASLRGLKVLLIAWASW